MTGFIQKTHFKIPWLFPDPFQNSQTINYPSDISYICVHIFQCAFHISKVKEHYSEKKNMIQTMVHNESEELCLLSKMNWVGLSPHSQINCHNLKLQGKVNFASYCTAIKHRLNLAKRPYIHCSKQLGKHFIYRVSNQCKDVCGAPVWPVVKPVHLWIDFTAIVLVQLTCQQESEMPDYPQNRNELCEGRQTQFSITGSIRC